MTTTQTFDFCELDNGIVILGAPMETVQSAAFGFLLPAGAARLAEGLGGGANVISDWVFRGAGDRDSRALSDAMDGLGLHRSSAVGTSFVSIGAALEAGNLATALDLYCDVISSPHLDPNEYEPARQLALEEVVALDDDPRHKVMLALRGQFYPSPLGRSTLGDIESLQSMTADQLTTVVEQQVTAGPLIMAVAGRYDFERVVDQIRERLGQRPCQPLPEIEIGQRGQKVTHLPNEGAQVHIGMMTETVTPEHSDYYLARAAISILSGGMSSRLFTEVREKRGLCYAVGARYHGLKQTAGITCYAGTTPDKAQETYDVICHEFSHLHEGLSNEELERAKIGLKASLVMQSESSSSRVGAIASDYYMLGRMRTLDEIKDAIDAVTQADLEAFLVKQNMSDFTVVTIGPSSIETA